MSQQNKSKSVQTAIIKMNCIGVLSTEILVLPYVGQQQNMIIMFPDEDRDPKMVRMRGRWL